MANTPAYKYTGIERLSEIFSYIKDELDTRCVQADWNESDNTKYSFIKNKPTIPTKVSDLTNDSGYITGITSSMVTTALGYTPYDSSNPSGYTSNTGTVTQVKVGTTAYDPSSGVVSLPAYPTTLPASDVYAWAKASTKPSYSYSEITGTVAIASGGTGATTAAGARENLATPYMYTDSYPTLAPANGTDNWIKIGTIGSIYGLLPSQSGNAGSGHNYIGTSTWYWKYAYIDQITGYLNGNISGSSSSCTGNAATATKATQDGDGNTISSTYLKLSGGTLTGNLTGVSAKFKGRYNGVGDDEGIIIDFCDNTYAGLCLGNPSGKRSAFYLSSSGSAPFWRYNAGSDNNLDIYHPAKSGTIALTSDIPTIPTSGYVERRQNTDTYTAIATAYFGGSINTYVRIKLPDDVAKVWTMVTMELLVRQKYTTETGGKILINCHHNATNPWAWTGDATLVGNFDDAIGIYGSDGKYLYIKGISSYANVAITNLLIGDTARAYDFSGTSIDSVSSLPTTYQYLPVYSEVTSKNIGSQSVDKATKDGDGNTISSTYLKLSGGTLYNSSSDTPLYIKGNSSGAYIGFQNSSGTYIGYYGVTSNDSLPYFYRSGLGAKRIALLDEVPSGVVSEYNYKAQFTPTSTPSSYVKACSIIHQYSGGVWFIQAYCGFPSNWSGSAKGIQLYRKHGSSTSSIAVNEIKASSSTVHSQLNISKIVTNLAENDEIYCSIYDPDGGTTYYYDVGLVVNKIA